MASLSAAADASSWPDFPPPEAMRIRRYSRLRNALPIAPVIFVLTVALIFAGPWWWHGSMPRPARPHHSRNPFTLISPSRKLRYSPCFDDYQCARLEVPMDWNSTTDPDTVALAVIRLPAAVPVTDARYGGMILVNPGGPGGSGVYKMLVEGKRIQSIVDTPIDPRAKDGAAQSSRYYDILCYDGRGVNNSTPQFSCIEDQFTRQRWTLQTRFNDLVGSSDIATDQALARARALAKTCSGENSPKLGKFINTTPSVADIVAIIEAHGAWREQEAVILLAQKPGLSPKENRDIIQTTAWDKGKELLQYWGYSYGSVTGTTFAAMYPNKVKRMIVDGICDARAMYDGLWTTAITDTDKVMNRFFDYCYEAGPAKCSSYLNEGPEKMLASLESSLASLNDTPLAVAGSSTHGPDVITYSDVLRAIKEAVYSPLDTFPHLSDLFADVSSHNGSKFATYKAKTPTMICPAQSQDPHHVRECPPYSDMMYDTLTAIACTDGRDLAAIPDQSKVFEEYYALLRTQSRWMADYWLSWTLPCWNWKTRRKWRYEGPISGRPAHPLLFIGNTYGPATPLQNAFDISKGFPGSVVLTQDSAGHCSYSSNSECISGHVRGYFQKGVLPEEGTVCAPDKQPWGV